MDVLLPPKRLSGTVGAIPSKSDAHRLLICAALADRPTELCLPKSSADIDATVSCLSALGAGIRRSDDRLFVSPIARGEKKPLLNCGESGSTLRFLLPVAAAVCQDVRFTGMGRLPERPISALIAAMRAHGVAFSADKLPFETRGRLSPGVFELPGNVSSQYITGLLLALSVLPGESFIRLTTPLESSAYVDITLAALKRFGARAERDGSSFFVQGSEKLRSPGFVRVDGDWSNAAFFLAAGALGDGVTVTGLSQASPQGDRAIVDILRLFGADVRVLGGAVTVSPARLRGLDIDVSEIPDLVPVLAVLAACASGETRLYNGARLRLKESDRIASSAAMLRSLGALAEETDDGLRIRGGALSGGAADGFSDHRIVMSAAVAAARCSGPVTILGAEAANKSYPRFFEDLISLGGEANVL